MLCRGALCGRTKTLGVGAEERQEAKANLRLEAGSDLAYL